MLRAIGCEKGLKKRVERLSGRTYSGDLDFIHLRGRYPVPSMGINTKLGI